MTPEERAGGLIALVRQAAASYSESGHPAWREADELVPPVNWPKRWLVDVIRTAMAEERVGSAEVIARWKGPVSRGAMVRAILAREDGPPPDEAAPGVSSRTELARWTADGPAPQVRTLVVELDRDDGRTRGLVVRVFGELGLIATVDLPMAFLGPALAGIPVEG